MYSCRPVPQDLDDNILSGFDTDAPYSHVFQEHPGKEIFSNVWGKLNRSEDISEGVTGILHSRKM
jgi:hypothetical protein